MAKKDTNWLLVAGIGVLAYFLLSGSNPFAGSGGTSTGGTNGGTTINVPPIDVICESSTTPDLNLQGYDGENIGTAITATYLLREKDTATTWANATTGYGTLQNNVGSPGKTIQTIALNGTGPHQDVVYAPFHEQTLTCEPTIVKAIPMYRATAAGSEIDQFYNEDGTANANETLTANQEKTVVQKYAASANTYIGNPYLNTSDNPYPNRFCLKINATGFDSVDVAIEGTNLDSSGIPQWLLTDNTAFSWRCWKAPVVDDKGVNFAITIDNGALSQANNDENGMWNATLIGANYFIDDYGKISSGVEDDNGARIGIRYDANFTRFDAS